jgi:plastocyanin
MSNTGWAAVIIALIIVLAGGWWYYSTQMPAATPATTDTTAGTQPTGTNQPSNNMVGGDASVDVGVGDNSTRVEVRYTANGFEPKSVTVVKGTAVTFINDTSGPMWVGADEHPTHTNYDGTSRATHCDGAYSGTTPFDQCQNGSTYTFVFTKAGTFGYHNHSAAQAEGTIIVQ